MITTLIDTKNILIVVLIATISIGLGETPTAPTPNDNPQPSQTAETRKPTGTRSTPQSKLITIPHRMELVAKDGRKITATVIGFEGGVQIRTDDQKTHVVKWESLSWETISQITGQELSYTEVGMSGFWVMGEAKCSRSR